MIYIELWDWYNESALGSGWTSSGLGTPSVADSLVGATSSSTTAYLQKLSISVDASKFKQIVARLKHSEADNIKVRYITDTDGTWNDTKSISLTAREDDEFNLYTFDFSDDSNYTGYIIGIRIHVTDKNAADIELDDVGFVIPDTYDEIAEFGPAKQVSTLSFSVENGGGDNNDLLEEFVEIWAKTDYGDLVFDGILMDVSTSGGSDNNHLKCVAYGFIIQLQQNIVEIYSSEDSDDIVKDLISKYGPSLSDNGVQATGRAISATWAGLTALQKINELASEDDRWFWVDWDKDCKYEPEGWVDYGREILDEDGDIIDWEFDKYGKEVINRVYVYGSSPSGTQIQVMVEDIKSQMYYGSATEPFIQDEVIIDKKIESIDDAKKRGQSLLDERAWIVRKGKTIVYGHESVKQNELVRIAIDEEGLDQKFALFGTKIFIDRDQTELQLAFWDSTVDSALKREIERMRRKLSEDIDTSGTLIKYFRLYEAVGVKVELFIYSRGVGTAFILGHSTNGVLGAGGTGRLGDGRGAETQEYP